MQAIVLGNVTLDVICQTVDDVPRRESITFDDVVISPGGCGTNVAVGLGMLKIPTALIGSVGTDPAARMVIDYLQQVDLDLRFLRRDARHPTAVSVGLVDSAAQPRFIHTPGANSFITADDLDIPALVGEGGRILHVGGYFVLPGLMDGRLAGKLAEARNAGLLTSLDVVQNVLMDDPRMIEQLWGCMPHLDYFLCNDDEARRLTGEARYREAASILRGYGARTVIVKLGAQGCWLDSGELTALVPAFKITVRDTTGAGGCFRRRVYCCHITRQGSPRRLPGGKRCRGAYCAGARRARRLVQRGGRAGGHSGSAISAIFSSADHDARNWKLDGV